MKRITALPIWNESSGALEGGTFFDVPDVCLKQKRKTCKKYYEGIKGKKGFHICPSGLSSYCTGSEIYSGVRVAGYYENAKIKGTDSFLPTIPPQVILQSIASSISIEKDIYDNDLQAEFDKELVDFCLHEVRQYNLIIKRCSEEYLTSKNKAIVEHEKLMKTVFASSSSITNRLNMYDFESNPKMVTASTPFQASVFQKFQKASHCLEIYARDAGVRISAFKGSLHTNIEMFPIFDFVPHVLLENAIKYSPSSQTIDVTFEEIQNNFEVKIESFGPSLGVDELSKIFEKGFRGKNAILVSNNGGGYGLYFAKLISELHGLKLTARKDLAEININGIPYSKFTMILSFDKLHNNILHKTSR